MPPLKGQQGPQRIDWIGRAVRYAEGAVADKKNAKHCKWLKLAAARFLSDIKETKKAKCGFYLCPDESARVCKFFETLPHVEGVWDTPTITLEDWQVFILVNIFGFRNKSNGRRRFTEIYLEVARKNAKSVFASGIGLYCLCFEGEIGPQVKCAATTGDQARIVFDVQKKMVEKMPLFKNHFKLEVLANVVACMKNGGTIKPINSKASTQDGLNPHCNIMDELHAHKTRDLFDVLHSAQGARKNPLNLMITTAGNNTDGVCYEQHKYVKKILEGVYKADHYFGVIFTLDDGDDPLDESKWIKANPNYGVSIIPEKMRQDAVDARMSPQKMIEFKTKRLNIWVTAKNGYINTVIWQKNKGTVNLEELRDVPCWGAFDLASVSDLTAWRLVWKIDNKVKTWGKFYIPEESVNLRTEKNGVPYRTWVDSGLITATPGRVTDYSYIEHDIEESVKRFNVQMIAFDEWNASYLAARLQEKNIPIIEFIQGTRSFNEPMREIERLYLSENIEHGGDPVLTWNASNIVIRKDVNENIAPDKKNSFEKIDGFVALAMCIGIMMRKDGELQTESSVYETRGIVEV